MSWIVSSYTANLKRKNKHKGEENNFSKSPRSCPIEIDIYPYRFATRVHAMTRIKTRQMKKNKQRLIFIHIFLVHMYVREVAG